MKTLGHFHLLTEGPPPRGLTQKILVWAETLASEEIIQEALRRLFDYSEDNFGGKGSFITTFMGVKEF